MPQRDVRMLLRDVLDACEAVFLHVRNRSLDEFKSDRTVRSATEREFAIITEAITQVNRLDPKIASRFTGLESILVFRNILIHTYHIVDPERMWRAIEEDIPVLRREAKELLDEASRRPL